MKPSHMQVHDNRKYTWGRFRKKLSYSRWQLMPAEGVTGLNTAPALWLLFWSVVPKRVQSSGATMIWKEWQPECNQIELKKWLCISLTTFLEGNIYNLPFAFAIIEFLYQCSKWLLWWLVQIWYRSCNQDIVLYKKRNSNAIQMFLFVENEF